MSHRILLAGTALVGLSALAVQAAPNLPPLPPLPNVNIVVNGEVRPGVYGRIEIGRMPQPQLVFPQPVVVVQPPQPLPRSPIYLHVPPGHAKNWGKHCHRYGACGQPVYFVKSREYEPDWGRKHRHDDRYRDGRYRDDDRHGHRDKGKGKGRRDD